MRIAASVRRGVGTPVLALHGFGSTKEDFADLMLRPELRRRPFVTYDAPGFGETECDNLSDMSIPRLRETAEWVIGRLGLDRFHLIGHSMGGLTALQLAVAHPEAVASFTNVEGNLSPEDCFLSRLITEYPSDHQDRFLAALADRVRGMPAYSSALFAAGLRGKVRAAAVPSIFRSIIDLSDHAPLLQQFLRLATKKMFVYGSLNRSLSYLDRLRRSDVCVTEIPDSGHFPMYANPPVLWARVAAFIDRSESEAAGGDV